MKLKSDADFRTYFFLAKTYIRLNAFEDAKKTIQTARIGLPSEVYVDVIIDAYVYQEKKEYLLALEKYNAFINRWGFDDPLFNVLGYIRCSIDAGKETEAIAFTRKMHHHYFDGWWPNNITVRSSTYAETYYLLGIAYERIGERSNATKAYASFLHVWKNADQNLPRMQVVKSRMSQLQ